ncbi:MAG: TRAP transporter large permease subunit, partial [Alphaproteobacteria bacterium]|nr:TRAP transporter large permease subunit [Alphaproteobacteria bacterium]
LRARGHLFIPIFIVLAGMFNDYSAPLAALAGTLACFPVAMLRKSTRQGLHWRLVIEALVDGAKNTLSVAMACAAAGIVIGVVALTGLGITFTQHVLLLAANSLVLALIVTAAAGIVLGMGMPTTPAYIIMTSLLVPAIIKLGVPEAAAHMFAFYYAVLSAITPPVALAVFAAASLAKSDLWTTGWAAVRIGMAGFIAPFMFIYEPALLTLGTWDQVAYACVPASIGIVCLAAGLHGYMLRALSWPERIWTIVAGLMLVKPGIVTDMIGYSMVLAIVLWQWKFRQQPAAA